MYDRPSWRRTRSPSFTRPDNTTACTCPDKAACAQQTRRPGHNAPKVNITKSVDAMISVTTHSAADVGPNEHEPKKKISRNTKAAVLFLFHFDASSDGKLYER